MVSFLKIRIPENIDFALIVKGLASLAVVFWHIHGWKVDQGDFLSYFVVSGRLAVFIFFMLSGYLIGSVFVSNRYQLDIKGIRRFYWNRFIRIYPLLLLISLVSLSFLGTGVIQGNYNSFWEFFKKEILMIQWSHQYLLNGVVWALGVEFQFYLVAPFLVWLQMKMPFKLFNPVLQYGICLIFFFIYSQSSLFHNYDMRFFLGNILFFQTGLTVSQYYHKISETKILQSRNALKFLFLSIILTILIINISYSYHAFWSLPGYLIVNFLGVLLIVSHVIIEKNCLKCGVICKLLSILGSLSYGLYLWHGFLLLHFNYLHDKFCFTLLFSLLLSYLTYISVEKMAKKWKSVF
ncbi:MAG: acyltransferase [Desulfotalea sp.]